MNVPVLGMLKPDPNVPEWLVSEAIAIPYFNGQKLTFTLDGLEASDEDEANRAVAVFLALGPQDREAAARYVFANYCYVAELVDKDDLGCKIRSVDDVWKHVIPSEVFVSRRHRHERAIYVQITAECDWENEHGLQLVYRRGNELSRVSEQDGHLTYTDAYALPETEDKIVEEPKNGANYFQFEKKAWWKLW